MDIEFDDGIFHSFRAAALSVGSYPSSNPSADELYQAALKTWSEGIILRRIELVTQTDQDCNFAWVFSPTSKNGGKHKKTAFKILIVGINPITGNIKVYSGEVKSDNYNKIFIPVFLSNLFAGKIVPSSIGLLRATQLKNASDFINAAANKLVSQAANKILAITEKLVATSGKRTRTEHISRTLLIKIANRTARKVFERNANSFLSEIEQITNKQVMNYAESISIENSNSHRYKQNSTLETHYSQLDFYNHIVSASTPDARQFRMGALKVLQPIRRYFFKEHKFWVAIDHGKPIFDELAKILSAKPSTIKRLIKNAKLYRLYPFEQLVHYLDTIDPSLWPTNTLELTYFVLAINITELHGKVFYRDPRIILSQWIKAHSLNTDNIWQELIEQKLSCEIAIQKAARQKEIDEIKKHSGQKQNRLKRLNDTRLAYPDQTDPRTSNIHIGKFFEECFERYRTALENIRHMQSDLSLRILRSAILLEIEEQCARLSEDEIRAAESHANQKLWSRSTPSEQQAASSYWHSERVNFADRFKSLSQRQNDWPPLMDHDYVSKNGSIIVPLTTSAALKEEADAMHHCVWSYSYRCLANAYHIFSVRNPDGVRLSTLTLQDFNDTDGLRKVKFIEHRGYKNAQITRIAEDAARNFADSINNRSIIPDWFTIDAKRSEFKVKEYEQSIGYDFRNPELRSRIFDLYEPCLPRRINSRKPTSIEALADALNLRETILSVIAARANTALRPTLHGNAGYNGQPAIP